MAEETNKSPLDSLGPQIGNMNLPAPNALNMQPFEGQSIVPDNINIPYNPFPIPSPARQDFNIKDNATGHLFAKDPAKNKDLTPGQFVDALKAKVFASANAKEAGNEYARLYSYDAGPSGQNFYKRYAAFGDETFEKIGFSPMRNNEAIYNANTTWSQKTGRMLANSAWPLFKAGFVSGPRSLMRMIGGDFGADPEDARLYAEASAIGMDTSGGVGAFMNNLTMNFAYTAGIMVEAIAEEAIGALLAAPTGGASFAAATLNNARKLGSLAGTAAKGVTTANAFGKALQGANNINNARKIWSAAKLEKGFSSSLGRFVNPIENTADAIFTSLKNADNLHGLARAYNTGYKTAGGFYRDVRSVNMALAEARLEGGFVQNEIYNDLYREFYDKHGYAPDEAMQKEMRKQALEGGMQTQMWNTGLIYLSNKVVFPNIVGPRGGLRSFLKSKTDDILDLKFGKVKKTMVPKTEGSKVMTPKYEWVENSFKNTLKETYKQPLTKLVPAVGNYFKANVMEGLQENFQEVIADASKNYHLDLFHDKNRSFYEYNRGLSGLAFSDYLGRSAEEHFKTSGLETFASGFFMGFLGGGLNKSFDYLSQGVNYIKDKDAYHEYKAAKNTYGKRIVDNLSTIDVKNFFDSRVFNFSEQLTTISKENLTKKVARDYEHKKFVSQLNQVLDHGMMEMFVDHLGSYKDLTPEEFQEALGFETLEEATEAQLKIDSTLEKARNVQKRYDNIKEMYPDPISSKLMSQLEALGKDSEEYQNAQLFNEAWRISRHNAVFFGESYDDVNRRMGKIISNMTSNGPLGEANAQDLSILFDPKKMYAEVDMLEQEIETAKQLGKESDPDTVFKRNKLVALKELVEKGDEFAKFNMTDETLKERIFYASLKQGKELSDDQLNSIIKNVKESLDEESILRSQSAYEKSYKNYLKVVGKMSESDIFDSKVDDSFEDLLDYYRLSDEKKTMAKAINTLNDPQAFVEHVDRNMNWMKNLYNNRKDYYTDMVNHAMDSILANDLINSLASEGIYISAEDLENLVNYNILPDEFYDDSKKIVIKRNNPLYEKYAAVLNHYLQEKNNPIGKSTGSEKLDSKIQELDEKMKAEIDKLPKEEKRVDLDPIEIKKDKTITYKSLLDKIDPGTYVEITYFEKGNELEAVLYRTEEGFKMNNEKGESAPFGNRTRISKAQPFKLNMIPDEEQVKEIVEKYDQLKENAVNETNEEELTDTPKVTGATLDNIQKNSPELFIKLQELYEESLGGPEEAAKIESFEYGEGFERFIKINSEARQLILKYNEKANLKKTIGDQEIELTINYNGIDTDINEIPEKDLKKILNTREFQLKALQEEKEPNVNMIASLKREIATIKKVLSKMKMAGLSPIQQEVVNKLEKLTAEEFPILDGKYIIDGEMYTRVSHIVEKLSGKQYEYKNKKALETLMLKVFKGKTFNADTVKEFISVIKDNIENESIESRRLNGFEFVDNQGVTEDAYGREVKTSLEKVEEKLKALLKSQEGASYSEVKDQIVNIIAENTYEESRVIGNYIDEAIRDFFSGVQPKFDPTRITQEAYDFLFGDITTTDEEGNPIKTGYLTNIKDIIENQGLYIYSKGITLYDTNTKVAGTIDLILVDRSGNVYIVDVKTGKANKWAHFAGDKATKGFNKSKSELTPAELGSKVEAYTLQQAIYSNLLYNMTGLESSISLLPIEQTVDVTTGKITGIKRSDVLPAGDARIKLNKDYQLTTDEKTVRAKVDEAIPRVTPQAPPTASTQTGQSSDIEARKADIERRRDEELVALLEGEYDWPRWRTNTYLLDSESNDIILSRSLLISREEAQRLIISYKEINAKYDAELDALEGEPGKTTTGKKSKEALQAEALAEEILNNVSKAPINWVMQKNIEMSKLIDYLSVEKGQEVGDALQARFIELQTEPEVTSDPSFSLEKNTKLVVINNIFKDENQTDLFAPTGSIAVVSKINDKIGRVTVKVKYDGKTSQRTFDLAELNNLFKLYEEVMEKDVTTKSTVRSSEEISNINETNSAVSDFVNNEELQKKAEANAAKSSIEDTENNLLDDLDC